VVDRKRVPQLTRLVYHSQRSELKVSMRGGRRRWVVWVILTLGILLSVYLASPLIALHSIASAVETRDAVALTERIEFPSLRRSLTKQIVAKYLELTGKKLPLNALGKRVAVSVADPVVARLMTVRALLDLLGKGDAGEKAKVPLERAPFTAASFESLWRLWLNSEYLGRSFYVYLPPKKSREEQFRAHLRVIGWRWRIVGLDLPEDLKEHLARELVKLTQDRLNPQGSQ
jgi:DUF2939 family protein